jgi:hypothetical protein
MPDGDIVLVHMHHLMRFAADGTFKSAVGAQGRGWLEFDGVHGIEVHPETRSATRSSGRRRLPRSSSAA